MPATVIIPARYGSTRFPAKILAAETGRPLVQHVVDRLKPCKRVRQVLVATDDTRIVEALRPYGTTCVMTSVTHQSGTDRIAEVARGLDDEILINVQGDEPEIEPEIVDALIERMETSGDDMATVATPFAKNGGGGQDPANPNLVKVVMGVTGYAIYFSRALIPFQRDGGSESRVAGAEALLHLGIYAYRRSYLLAFAGWAPTPLELTEKLEQLRALEHGSKIYVLKASRASHGIDTPEQYQEFVKRNQRGSDRVSQGVIASVPADGAVSVTG